jgi:hypothetical protein
VLRVVVYGVAGLLVLVALVLTLAYVSSGG